MKFLILFDKGDSVRWLGHLDILRTFERAIRRADLPVAFSAGFNPRERLAFASALGVGVTGSQEPATLELTEALEPGELVYRLNETLPPGIRIRSAEEIPDAGSRDLLNSFDRAELRVTCACAPDLTLDQARVAVAELMARTAIPHEREREGKRKTVDLRPYIHELDVEDLTGERLILRMVLAVVQEGTARPAEIVDKLADALPGLAVRRIHRVQMLKSGQLASRAD